MLNIEELHKLVLNIAKEFHKVCNKHGIPYYMLYGTMLGAMRHKGFIPWDDDMDFGVPFEYYDLLVTALKKELPTCYRCVTRYDKQGAIGGYLKIENTETTVYEKCRLHNEENTGVFIDVFFLYSCNETRSWFSKVGLIKICTLIQAYRFYNFYSEKTPIWQHVISKLTKIFLRGLDKPLLIDFYEKHLIEKCGDFWTTHSSPYNLKDIIKKEVYGKPILYPFEDTFFYGVEMVHDYLANIYGNYMELPPIEKRHQHSLNVSYRKK